MLAFGGEGAAVHVTRKMRGEEVVEGWGGSEVIVGFGSGLVYSELSRLQITGRTSSSISRCAVSCVLTRTCAVRRHHTLRPMPVPVSVPVLRRSV